jgi:hypothetical protein
MIQTVDATLSAEAIPKASSVVDPVVPGPAKYIVSLLIAIVTVLARFTKLTTVPIGYGTLAFEGMVNVLALLSEVG